MINVLTYIAMAIISFCCIASIIVLSVFNGLEELLRSLNHSFDPELKITLTKGKSFEYTEELKNRIGSVDGVELITEVIEDYAYIKYNDAEMVVTMKGVSEDFLHEHRIDNSIIYGDLKLRDGETDYAILGYGVQQILDVDVSNDMNGLTVHYIKDIKRGSFNTSNMYSRKNILPSAIFSIQRTFDEGYIFVPLGFASDLLDYGNRRTSLEIRSTENTNLGELKERLKKELGSSFVVLDNEEQHADLYKLLNVEKLFMFLAMVLLLGVSSVNVLFVLSMLAIEKKKDISVLYSLGAGKNIIRKIFIKEGLIISTVGAATGLAIGAVICLLQEHVGLVSMGMESAVQSAYPIRIVWTDFIYIFICLVIITFLVSFRPAKIASGYRPLENL